MQLKNVRVFISRTLSKTATLKSSENPLNKFVNKIQKCTHDALRNERSKFLEEHSKIKNSNVCGEQQPKCGKSIEPEFSCDGSKEWPKGNYIIAGAISGALAMAIDIFVKRRWRIQEYNASKSPGTPPKVTPEMKETFENANRVHLMNSAIMLAIPYVARKPLLTFALITSGTLGFSGINYYLSFREKTNNSMELAWIGGILIMIGWFSFTL